MAIPSAHAQIAKILEIAKETHWLENKHLPVDEIRRQWANKSAPLAAVLGPAAPSHPVDLGSTAEKSALPQNVQTTPPISRAISSSRRNSINNTASHGLTASCSVNQTQVSQPMSNKRSSHSKNGPFSNTGSSVEPLALDSWQASNEEPFSAFTIPTSPRPTKARRTASACSPLQIPEYDTEVREYDPGEYVRNSRAMLTPTFSPSMRSRRSSNQQRSPLSSLSQSPATLSDGFTNPTTLSTADMQRQESCGGSSFCGGLDMLRLDSRRSEVVPQSDKKVNSLLSPPFSSTSNSFSDAPAFNFPLSVSHAGGVMNDPNPSSNLYVRENPDLFLGQEEDKLMVRTVSSESSSSSQSRISRRSEEQALLSTRPIAPKDTTELMTRQSSSSSSLGPEMARQVSADGTKVAIQKAKYTRPPHDKVYCDQCNIKPEGFRGPHELRRHIDNKHCDSRKVWVCKDSSPDQMFLSKCKACKEGKKYGAYYNAAAHLRRIHFNPREKSKKGDKSAKARGGDGGGDEPPMEILKLWMTEIDNPAIRRSSNDDSDEDRYCVNAEAAQDGYDSQAYDTIGAQPDFSTPSVDRATASHLDSPLQEHDLLVGDGTSVQSDYLSPEHTPSFVSTANEETFTDFGFSSTLASNSSEQHDINATTNFPLSAPAAPQPKTNTVISSSVNQPLAPENLVPDDMSFNSTMNNPADLLDLFEYDIFDFS